MAGRKERIVRIVSFIEIAKGKVIGLEIKQGIHGTQRYKYRYVSYHRGPDCDESLHTSIARQSQNSGAEVAN